MDQELIAVLTEFKNEIKNDVTSEIKGLEFRIGERINALDEKVEKLDEKVTVLDRKVTVLDENVAVLNEKVERLENRVEKLETRTGRLESRMEKLETRTGRLESRMEKLEARTGRLENSVLTLCGDVKEIKLTLETVITPNIQKIAEGYKLLEERLDREAEEEQTYRRNIELRIGALVNQN